MGNGTYHTGIEVSADRQIVAGDAADGSDAQKITDWSFEGKAYVRVETKTYDILYYPGANGTGTAKTASKTHGIDITLPGAAFTKVGYTQSGLATSDGGAKVCELGATYPVDADVTLYPAWTVNR